MRVAGKFLIDAEWCLCHRGPLSRLWSGNEETKRNAIILRMKYWKRENWVFGWYHWAPEIITSRTHIPPEFLCEKLKVHWFRPCLLMYLSGFKEQVRNWFLYFRHKEFNTKAIKYVGKWQSKKSQFNMSIWKAECEGLSICRKAVTVLKNL